MPDPLDELLAIDTEIAKAAGEALAAFKEVHRRTHDDGVCRVMAETMPATLDQVAVLVFLSVAIAQQGPLDDPREKLAEGALKYMLSVVYGLGLSAGRGGR